MKSFLCNAILIGSIGLGGLTLSAADHQPMPTNKSVADEFDKIEKQVWKYFESMDNFRSADLIAREDVEPLLKKLAAAGFTLKKPDDLYKKLLTKNDFIYVQLNTPAGRNFMREIASYPNGYDRLERLSRLPRGEQTVRDLIRGPGGERMIDYMTNAAGGKELGKYLSKDPNGGDFNAATGKIYTVSDLLKYLKEKYESQKKAGTSSK
jgi:hypothetical protein